jgi:aarF domain-containing kinase
MVGDEAGIAHTSKKLGLPHELYRLFACMLTGRAWETIEQADLSKTVRTSSETNRIQGKLPEYLEDVAHVLRKVPRVVLLLFKTHDLLRAVEEHLHTNRAPEYQFIIMAGYCLRAIRREKIRQAWGARYIVGILSAWLDFCWLYGGLSLVEMYMSYK